MVNKRFKGLGRPKEGIMKTASGKILKIADTDQLKIFEDALTLQNVHYVPQLDINLLSVGALEADGWEVLFRNG